MLKSQFLESWNHIPHFRWHLFWKFVRINFFFEKKYFDTISDLIGTRKKRSAQRESLKTNGDSPKTRSKLKKYLYFGAFFRNWSFKLLFSLSFSESKSNNCFFPETILQLRPNVRNTSGNHENSVKLNLTLATKDNSHLAKWAVQSFDRFTIKRILRCTGTDRYGGSGAYCCP